MTVTETSTAQPSESQSPTASPTPSKGPLIEPAPRSTWFAAHQEEIRTALEQGKQLAGAAAAASETPAKLLTIAAKMATLADRLNELGFDAPSYELSHLLWDLSDAELATSYATEDFASATQDRDLYGMKLANEDAAAARRQMAAALSAYAAYSASHS